ncbi:molybdenum ABC transporter ATP-binding protein [Parasedimentitalea psychrophila]|uniref:Molybdenum ABC transporter ATP-binding protein n=1 Tax=Parasedimentitalea psychrophila TaxID=2997337 RepID=A0A9Y2KYP1_9RHOB|nr:molybdenum ABC transporter ATP-binding protein [Parasedimentitalea psychrophila]WIY24312.1 molybdenum ABC transporter ATP-binding protein [Parasedimentitalea psychrophila]
MSLSVDISHNLGDLTVQVAFQAPSGITALFGKSGSGKTTVINAVAGLLTPDAGRIASQSEVLFDSKAGIDLPAHRRRLGYVFQESRLFPHLSVLGNLNYGKRFAPKGSSGPGLEEVTALLGISSLLHRRPGTLSGGEKQRVAIGRALLSRPQMLLMDEPLAALDSARKDEILPFLEQLRDSTGLPILYVSHSVAEVARLATTVVVLEQGKVAQAGPTEQVFSDPAMVRHLGLRQAGSVLPAVVKTHHSDGLTELTVSGGRLLLPQINLQPSARTRVRILAQDVILSRDAPKGLSALNILSGTVTEIRAGGGPGVVVQICCGSDLLLARITQRSANALQLAPGLRCHAILKSVSVARHDVGHT